MLGNTTNNETTPGLRFIWWETRPGRSRDRVGAACKRQKALDGKVVEWMEKVSDEQHQK
ncbi:MAG TPA: hypothetical protein VGL29_21380 [Blastocatellia bacterium]|jgi:hypothetical protein